MSNWIREGNLAFSDAANLQSKQLANQITLDAMANAKRQREEMQSSLSAQADAMRRPPTEVPSAEAERQSGRAFAPTSSVPKSFGGRGEPESVATQIQGQADELDAKIAFHRARPTEYDYVQAQTLTKERKSLNEQHRLASDSERKSQIEDGQIAYNLAAAVIDKPSLDMFTRTLKPPVRNMLTESLGPPNIDGTWDYTPQMQSALTFLKDAGTTQIEKWKKADDEATQKDKIKRREHDVEVLKETKRNNDMNNARKKEGNLSVVDGQIVNKVTGKSSAIEGFKRGVAEGRPISRTDALSIDKSMTVASGANGALQLLDNAAALYGKYASGLGEVILGPMGRAGAVVGLADEARVTDYEIAGQIAKDLGVIKLGLIGGSDTERELRVAIDTSPSPDKLPKTNMTIIANQRRAIEILQAEPDFKTLWVNRNGSLSSLDIEDKGTYGKAWRQFQKENFKSKTTAPKSPQPTGSPTVVDFNTLPK